DIPDSCGNYGSYAGASTAYAPNSGYAYSAYDASNAYASPNSSYCDTPPRQIAFTLEALPVDEMSIVGMTIEQLREKSTQPGFTVMLAAQDRCPVSVGCCEGPAFHLELISQIVSESEIHTMLEFKQGEQGPDDEPQLTLDTRLLLKPNEPTIIGAISHEGTTIVLLATASIDQAKSATEATEAPAEAPAEAIAE
ncbi:unnamed protein product, partial [marine sediment metagenome]